MVRNLLKFCLGLLYFRGRGKMRNFFCDCFPSPDNKLLKFSSGIRNNPNKDEAFKKATQWLSSMSADISLDSNGLSMPSYSVAAMHFLDERLKKEMKVFEFGSGLSSLFYARKCKSVTSIEHNQEWFEKVTSHEIKNLSVFLKNLNSENGDYEKAIFDFDEQYDLIVVDGRNRNKCIFNCIKKLTKNGVIILDDSHRDKYLPGKQFLEEQGFKSLKMFSPASSKLTFTETTFFYRTGNCLGI